MTAKRKSWRDSGWALLLALATCSAPAWLAAAEDGGSGSPATAEQTGEPAGESASGEESASDEEPTLDERLDALLSEVLSAEEYRETRRCLSRHAYRRVEVLNEEYLLFSKGNNHWLNRLKRPCPSLKFDDVPVFEQRGTSSLCESSIFYPTNTLDLDRGFDTAGRPLITRGTCYLGTFEKITVEQAALLREP